MKSATLLFFLFSMIGLVSCGNDNQVPLAAVTKAGQDQAAALYNSGRAAEAAGNTGRAIKLYEDVVGAYPLAEVAADARFRHASLLDRGGNALDAFESYQKFLTQYPASREYQQALKRQEAVALAAADGEIKTSFLGIRSGLGPQKLTEMLTKVRDNAPRSPSAPRAQFKVGEVWQKAKRNEEAIAAFRKLTLDFPDSNLAPEAQFRIGAILMAQARQGNQDQANLARARDAYDDLILRYPNSSQAREAKGELAKLGSADIKSSYEVAEFYRKKGQTASAIFYYQEVVRKSPPGELRTAAERKLRDLGAR